MKAFRFLFPLLASGLLSAVFAEAVKDREGAVRKDKAEMQNDARWIYNDWQKGFAESRRTGKPLLIVLRCVPCLSCMGLDASVLTSPDLAPLLDQFVCVRLINANAIELAKFQFDYDLSFSTLFFNADGTLYGRYGSWSHQKDPAEKTTAGYKRSLEAALAIHTAYPVNKAVLAGKQGGPTPFATPVEIPLLAGRYKRDLDWEGKVVGSCVHCHQIGDAYRAFYRDQGKPLPSELIYPMPMPETVGVTLEPDQIARVKSVVSGSIAAQAGVQAGDEFVAGLGLLEELADELTLGHACGLAMDFHQHVVLLKARILCGGVLAVLAEAFHEQPESVFREAARCALLVGQIHEHHAAGGHAAHGPGADATRNVGLGAPAGR
ncbi:MAG: hypothetical protein EB141_13060 [Verrucomicrobia bacterium]|nr:hypothetical protein [Verrucomicrobiota bacterium]